MGMSTDDLKKKVLENAQNAVKARDAATKKLTHIAGKTIDENGTSLDKFG
jgi:hypothetical protein